MIILTSFQESRRLLKRDGIKSRNPNVYSVARNQPAGFSYQSLYFLAAVDIHGQKLHLRGLDDPINSYRTSLFGYYNSMCDVIIPWVLSLDNSSIDILCCWCPHSESTKNQVKRHGDFVCHTGLIGQIINDMRPDIDVYMDGDRHNKLIYDYKPKYKVLGI